MESGGWLIARSAAPWSCWAAAGAARIAMSVMQRIPFISSFLLRGLLRNYGTPLRQPCPRAGPAVRRRSAYQSYAVHLSDDPDYRGDRRRSPETARRSPLAADRAQPHLRAGPVVGLRASWPHC